MSATTDFIASKCVRCDFQRDRVRVHLALSRQDTSKELYVVCKEGGIELRVPSCKDLELRPYISITYTIIGYTMV